MDPVNEYSVEPIGVRNLRMLRARMEVERLVLIRLMGERKAMLETRIRTTSHKEGCRPP